MVMPYATPPAYHLMDNRAPVGPDQFGHMPGPGALPGNHPGSGPTGPDPNGVMPGQPPPASPGLATGPGALLRATYQAVVKARGVPYLAADDPALLTLYQAIGGLNPQQATVAAQRAAQYARTRGFSMGDAELNGMLAELRGAPTGQETTPMPGVGAQIRQDYDTLLQQRGVQSLGADDPQLLAAVQSRIPGLTAQQARQVAQAGRDFYATTGVVAPDSVVDRAAGQAKGFSIPLPHQFDPARWDAINRDPVATGLLQAQVQAAGWDWDTYKRQHLAARPGGQATPTTGTQFAQPTGVFG